MLGITLSEPAKAQLKLVQTCDKNTTPLNNSMDKSIENLYKIAMDQNDYIKRLEKQVDLLTDQVTMLQDDLINYRKEKSGLIPNRKLPMASAKTNVDSDIPDMSQVNRARIRLSM